MPRCVKELHLASGESGRLAGQVAVVTGASGGIGRAIACALAREGARIYAVGRNSRNLGRTVAEAGVCFEIVDLAIDLTSEQQLGTC